MAIIGPRFGILVWWLVDQDRWVALLGFVFLPWTTIMWVLVATNGVNGFDWIILGLGLMFDLFSYSGGGYTGRQRYYTA
jgi:hypothetical protein